MFLGFSNEIIVFCYYLTSVPNFEVALINHLASMAHLEESRSSPKSLARSLKGYKTGLWSTEEHELFLQGMFLARRAEEKNQNQWIMISAVVKTRSVSQVRSHAQKYFNKKAIEKEKHGAQNI